MKKNIRLMSVLMMVVLLCTMLAGTAFAADEEAPARTEATVSDQEETATDAGSTVKTKAIAAAALVGAVAAAGAFGMAWSITKASDNMARQPEVEGKIRTMLMLGLVFLETTIIYALIVAILIIFVL